MPTYDNTLFRKVPCRQNGPQATGLGPKKLDQAAARRLQRRRNWDADGQKFHSGEPGALRNIDCWAWNQEV